MQFPAKGSTLLGVVEREHSGSLRLKCPFKLAAVAAAGAFALAACTAPDGTGTATVTAESAAGTLEGPGPQELDGQSLLPEDAPGAPAGGSDPSAEDKGKDDGGNWGSYSSATDACAAVASGVTVLTVAPLNLLSGVDEDQLRDLEAGVRDLARKAPEELHEPLAGIEAEIGRHDGLDEFDYAAFRDALDPLDDWLDTHCSF
ncbi:hypothetical protein [Crystallibacter crystallopoietes]|nr:hypothetical protein [Arthrobacter crystallopoietes]